MSPKRVMLPRLKICSRSEAAQILRAADGSIATMVSIGDPGDVPPPGLSVPRRVLRLEFRDTILIADPDGPREEDAASIVEFAQTVEELGGTCLIHCQAGLSRSPATAVLMLAAMLGSGRDLTAAREVRRLVPQGFPNPLLVQLGDSLLGRRGSLSRAVEAVFDAATL